MIKMELASERGLLEGIPLETINENRLLSLLAGQFIDWRIENHATQEVLANKLGLHQSMVSKYENMTENPSVKTIAEYLAKLNIIVQEINCDKYKTATCAFDISLPLYKDDFLIGFNGDKAKKFAYIPFTGVETHPDWSGDYGKAM